jgi:hypothetical protein
MGSHTLFSHAYQYAFSQKCNKLAEICCIQLLLLVNLHYTDLHVAAINKAFKINISHFWLCVQRVALHWSTVIFAVIPSWWSRSMVESFIISKNDCFIMTYVLYQSLPWCLYPEVYEQLYTWEQNNYRIYREISKFL